jgi:hypothetical protein
MQQSPASQNAGDRGQGTPSQPSTGQSSHSMPQQQPANQNAGAGQEGNPSATQSATTWQGGGDRTQQPATKQDSDTSGGNQKPQGNSNSDNK